MTPTTADRIAAALVNSNFTVRPNGHGFDAVPPATRFLTTRQAAAAWSRSLAYVKKLALAGAIPGALRPGHEWLIPADFTPPPLGKRGRKPSRTRLLTSGGQDANGA